MLFVLLPSLQFTDDISSKHTHLFQIRGKDTTFLLQIRGNTIKVWCKSGARCLSKKLVIEDDVKECNAEIAACCMWHMSFYGYLPYQQDECFDDMFDGIEKKKMRAKLYMAKFADVISSGKKAS